MSKLLACIFAVLLIAGFFLLDGFAKSNGRRTRWRHKSNTTHSSDSNHSSNTELNKQSDEEQFIRDDEVSAADGNTNHSNDDHLSNQLIEGGPLFIIAGTQKSGTTALAAFLSLHPNISMSKRKELHFFDKESSYKKGIANYLVNFNGNGSTVWFGEATPFYVASRVACKRIGEHFPNVKMIVLLREPVARAYSEYQMKARRVKEHEELVHLLTNHRHTVVQCLELHTTNYKALKKCLPTSISSHGRYGKFTKALEKSMTKWDDWSKVVDSCFPHKIFSVAANQRHMDLSKRLTDVIYSNKSNTLVHPKMNSSPYSRLFHANGCWQNYKEGFETLQPLNKSFFQEIDAFLECSSSMYPTSFLANRSMPLQSRLQILDEVIEQCIKVKGGISKQYVYRSMYAPQLFNCFKYLKQEQFLLLDSNTLRHDLTGTMQKVLDFLNLPMDLEWLPHRDDEESVLVGVVQSKFSAFEKTTSWRLQSSYEPIDEGTKNELRSFFEKYNDLLFELISNNFTNQWYGDEVEAYVTGNR